MATPSSEERLHVGWIDRERTRAAVPSLPQRAEPEVAHGEIGVVRKLQIVDLRKLVTRGGLGHQPCHQLRHHTSQGRGELWGQRGEGQVDQLGRLGAQTHRRAEETGASTGGGWALERCGQGIGR